MGSTPTGISGSRAAGVLGLSQWKTPADAWLSIMEEREPGFCEANGYTAPEYVESAPARWGLAFENAVIELAEESAGAGIGDGAGYGEIGDREKEFTAPDLPFVTCHVDGVYRNVTPATLHEGKTANSGSFFDKWGEPGSDRIPRDYQVQVQHQMACTGADRVIVSVLVWPRRVDEWEKMHGGELAESGRGLSESGKMLYQIDDEEKRTVLFVDPSAWAARLAEQGYFHQYTVDADPDLQRMMIEYYREWWKRCVIGRTAPPAETFDDIKRLFPEPKGTVIATPEQIRMSHEYKQISAEVNSMNKRKAELKTRLLAAILDGAEYPIDSDSVEKIVLRSPEGKKLHSYGKTKKGLSFR